MKKQERNAIEAVARRFSATREDGNDPSGVSMSVAGKRVTVDITTLKRRRTHKGKIGKPRLRFDKVVTRLLGRVRSTFEKTVPDGMTVLLTVTAPIRLPSKTTAALEEKIRTLLERRSPSRDKPAHDKPARDEKDTIHGNHVHLRLLRHGSDRVPKTIGFVHNIDSDPLLLLNMTGELLELSSFEAKRRVPGLEADRWLLVISSGESSSLEAYRYIYGQLSMATSYKKILMVFGDGRVGTLTG